MDGHVSLHYYDYHEIKEHAGRDFPFNIYPCSIPFDFKLVPVHWHEEMEIISVKKGRGLVTVDMVPYEVGMGDATNREDNVVRCRNRTSDKRAKKLC